MWPDDAPQDDSALVRAARGGDMGAFALLLARHRPVLLALCRRTLGDPALAEDAAQEASLQALLALDRLHSVDRFGSWLAGIGLNVCRMWLRARARECWSWDALDKSFAGRGRAEMEGAEVAGRVLRLVADDGGHGDPDGAGRGGRPHRERPGGCRHPAARAAPRRATVLPFRALVPGDGGPAWHRGGDGQDTFT